MFWALWLLLGLLAGCIGGVALTCYMLGWGRAEGLALLLGPDDLAEYLVVFGLLKNGEGRVLYRDASTVVSVDFLKPDLEKFR